jgi:hypothetical protein
MRRSSSNRAMLGSVADEVNRGWASLIDEARAFGAFSDSGELVGLARDFDARLTVPGGNEVPAAGVHRRGRPVPPPPPRPPHPPHGCTAREPGRARHPGRPPRRRRVADLRPFRVRARDRRVRVPPRRAGSAVHCGPLRHHRRGHPRGAPSRARARPRAPPAADARIHHAGAGGVGRRGRAAVVAGPPARSRSRSAARCGRTRPARSRERWPTRSIDHWERNRPAGKAEVRLLVGATPEAERELWRHLCEIDWVATVTAANRGRRRPAPADARRRPRRCPVDLSTASGPACSTARRASARALPAPDRVVAEVTDPQGFADGRWSIDLVPDGAEVKPSDADRRPDAAALAPGAAFLGGRSVRRLHEAGWVDEATSGASTVSTHSSPPRPHHGQPPRTDVRH